MDDGMWMLAINFLSGIEIRLVKDGIVMGL